MSMMFSLILIPLMIFLIYFLDEWVIGHALSDENNLVLDVDMGNYMFQEDGVVRPSLVKKN